ncbi:MAG: tetratricopeptide repeat protein, partial [Pseudomonadota bacterium]
MPRLDVKQIPSVYKRARRLHSAGRTDAAEALYRQILAIRPQTTEAHYQLARLYGRNGRHAKALRSFEKAIAQKPGEAAIWASLTETLLEWRDSSQVVGISDRLVQAGHARAVLALLTKLADRFLKQGAAGLARPVIERALKIAPGRPDLLTMLGDALSFLQAPDAALSSYDKAIAAAPGADFPKIQKAVLLQTLGRFDDAELLLREALEHAPNNGRLFRLLTSGGKMTAGDPLIARMQETFAKPDLRPADRIPLGFALAKALEDIGAFDRVFPVLNVANGLVRKTFPYDIRTRTD